MQLSEFDFIVQKKMFCPFLTFQEFTPLIAMRVMILPIVIIDQHQNMIL